MLFKIIFPRQIRDTAIKVEGFHLFKTSTVYAEDKHAYHALQQVGTNTTGL